MTCMIQFDANKWTLKGDLEAVIHILFFILLLISVPRETMRCAWSSRLESPKIWISWGIEFTCNL